MPSNCWGCNDILPHTKKAKLCQSCRIADKDKKPRPKWVTDKVLAKRHGGEWEGGKMVKNAKIEKIGEVTCDACKRSLSPEDERKDHCCLKIKELVWDAIDDIRKEYDIGRPAMRIALSGYNSYKQNSDSE